MQIFVKRLAYEWKWLSCTTKIIKKVIRCSSRRNIHNLVLFWPIVILEKNCRVSQHKYSWHLKINYANLLNMNILRCPTGPWFLKKYGQGTCRSGMQLPIQVFDFILILRTINIHGTMSNDNPNGLCCFCSMYWSKPKILIIKFASKYFNWIIINQTLHYTKLHYTN